LGQNRVEYIYRKRCEIELKLQLMANRKLHMGFRFVQTHRSCSTDPLVHSCIYETSAVPFARKDLTLNVHHA